MDALKCNEGARASVVRAGSKVQSIFDGIHEPVKMTGRYKVEHIRDGKVINVIEGFNTITNAGKNSLLGIMFHADTQITAWYIGLVDNSGWTAFAAADTAGSHSGWTESVAYSDSTRQAWSVGASSGQSITNGTPATFNINATATIKGIFVTSLSTKSGTTGTLWNGVAFSSTIAVNNGDQLKVTYTVSC